jgi:hypothetical protein
MLKNLLKLFINRYDFREDNAVKMLINMKVPNHNDPHQELHIKTLNTMERPDNEIEQVRSTRTFLKVLKMCMKGS